MIKEEKGIVIETDDGIAKVRASRHNNCEHCGACPGTDAITLEALNPIQAKPGQRVAFVVHEMNMVQAAFVVYILPLVSTFLGVLGGGYATNYMSFNLTTCQIVGGILGLILSLAYAKYVDNKAKLNVGMRPVIKRKLS